MRKTIVLIMCAVMLITAVSCDFAKKSTDTSGNSQVSSNNTSSDASVPSTDFAWKPAASSDENADVAGRRAFGIVDSYDDIYYYQGLCNDCVYALYSYNRKTDETELLAHDCYGMINAMQSGVYYAGYNEKGLFCYDYSSKTSKKICSGDIANAVICGENAYIITVKNNMYTVDLSSGKKDKVAGNISPYYLELISGYVYYSQFASGHTFDLYKLNVEDDEATCIADAVSGSIIKVYENTLFYKTNDAVFAVDISSGEQTTLIQDDIFSVAVNGNFLFYTKIDSTGFSELFALNLETNEAEKLVNVHGSSIYFMDSQLYVVDAVNFGIEKVIISQDGFSTQWIVK